ncbi:hypothetical protein C8J57DRAFT_1255537 [Mycena rebaudengoi]|nr:hypothetical protein C8J57DRAFT_1255537 [Mycena rebaudengoi]
MSSAVSFPSDTSSCGPASPPSDHTHSTHHPTLSTSMASSTTSGKKWLSFAGAAGRGHDERRGVGVLCTGQSCLRRRWGGCGCGRSLHPRRARAHPARAGKAQDKDVGMWFGPSAAAGAVRTLVDAFPACGLGVSVATDGMLYQTEVYTASHTPVVAPPLKSHHSHGSQPQLVFARLVVASQLLLLIACLASEHLVLCELQTGDDNEAMRRPPRAAPARHPTGARWRQSRVLRNDQDALHLPAVRRHRGRAPELVLGVQGDGLFYLDPHHSRPAVPLRPPPASRAGSQEPRAGSLEPRAASPQMTEGELVPNAQRAGDAAEEDVSGMTRAEAAFYQRVHAPAELRTFHCEKVRKMLLSGLDPSMLLGFVCRHEGEWVGLRWRIALLPRTIFVIQDEPLTWPGADDDDGMGLESVSDPEEEDADDGEGSMWFFDEGSASTHYHSNSNSTTSNARSEEADTEEDPVAPITALPTTTRLRTARGEGHGGLDAGQENDMGGDTEDDWVDPVPPPPVAAPVPVKKSKSASGKSKEGKEKKEKSSKTKKAAVPVPSVHYPFPVSVEDGATGNGQQQQRAEERERKRQRNVTVSLRLPAQGRSEGQRMHTVRARDRGCTQSGGAGFGQVEVLRDPRTLLTPSDQHAAHRRWTNLDMNRSINMGRRAKVSSQGWCCWISYTNAHSGVPRVVIYLQISTVLVAQVSYLQLGWKV